jgi:hypothetical protein
MMEPRVAGARRIPKHGLLQIEDSKRAVPLFRLFRREMLNLTIDDLESARECRA